MTRIIERKIVANMFCMYCGKEIDNDSKFCSFCGKRLPILEFSTLSDKKDECVRNDTKRNREAVEEAKDTLDAGEYSYQGLIDQLIFERFTPAQAKYGADHCNANWNKQAVRSANAYLKDGMCSIRELTEYLEDEKFTEEQIQYAFDHCSSDWNKHAIKFAKENFRYSA